MELQVTDEDSQSTLPAACPPPSSPTKPAHPPSASVPSLRFPKPQGSHHLATWVSNSSPDIMQRSDCSDAGSLADSAYELINSTDGEAESQDGRMAESLSSLDAARPEDVHSIEGSEAGYASTTDDDDDDDDEEEGEEDQHSSSDASLRYADSSLQVPSSQVLMNNLQYGVAGENSPPLNRSIEFHEGEDEGEDTVYLEKVSVKHTIRELGEDQSLDVAGALGIPQAPKRMIATIRQTMSQGCLSTREPLRVLYVGSPAGQKDIVYKLSSAIWTSGATDPSGKVAYQKTEGIYNIVPISSFGSTAEPEIQLMETSGYQIKVEHCTFADEIVYEGQFFPGDTLYSLTIDQEKIYRSLFSPSGSVVQPKWTVPHIAIFYLTEADDEQAVKTRLAAWKFMKRHGVPSVFVSHTPIFGKPTIGDWEDYVDPHAIHMCLESRDPAVPNFSQRLPIDLASFINIDARQMNRNLSYLTGLVEPSGEPDALESNRLKTLGHIQSKAKAALSLKAWRDAKLAPDEATCVKLSLAVLVFILTLAFSSSVGWTTNQASLPPQAASIMTAPVATLSTVSSTTSTKYTPATTTTTVVINVTSTKTVKISQVEPTASSLAPVLSFAGFLSDKPSGVPAEAEISKALCSVEVHSQNEILVKLPSGSKSSWLAKGAINIDVYRGEKPVKSKLSSIDEGLLVEIGAEDAFGVLNISVVTSRKPKINETFEINFGKPRMVEILEAGMHLLQGLAEKVASKADEAAHLVEDNCRPAVVAGMEKLHTDAQSVMGRILNIGRVAQSYSSQVAEDTVNQVKNSLKPTEVTRFFKEAQRQLTRRLPGAEDLRDNIEFSVLKAQIASKLWWLKTQGKTEEYAEYERQATHLLKKKQADLQPPCKRQKIGDCGPGCAGPNRLLMKHYETRCKGKESSRWKKLMG